MNSATIGALQGLLVAVIMAIVTWLANSANLNGVVSTSMAGIISMIALSIERYMASGTSTALFGSVSTKTIQ